LWPFSSLNDVWEWLDISQTDQSEPREKFSFVKYKTEAFYRRFFLALSILYYSLYVEEGEGKFIFYLLLLRGGYT
jgi:hypothetical protein